MRRWFALLFLPLLAVPAEARSEKPCAGLIICGAGEEILEGLYDRGLRGTFLLQGSRAAQTPQLLERILQEGHEVGCRGYTGKNMVYMSRRTIAGELILFQSLLPEGYPLRLFMPPGGCGDGVLQVAKARKLGILSWSRDLSAKPEEIRDGDLILLSGEGPLAAAESLALADALTERGFRLMPVAELAKLRRVRIRPGEIYHSFPPAAGE